MSVNENLKNAFYTSVGMALKGKEKIEECAKEFAEKNKLNAEEGASFVKEVMAGFDKKNSEAQEFVKETVHKTISELGLVSRKEYEDLQKKYEELKAKLDEK